MFREQTLFGQPSWLLESDRVSIAVTHTGAQMAPVHFQRNDGAAIQPYHISPWQMEECTFPEGASEAILRGDFLCLPFGYAEPGLAMRSHGRTSGLPWMLEEPTSQGGAHSLQIAMDNALQSARVTRRFLLRDGENVVYDLTAVDGLDGTYTIGHHAVLRTPKRNEALLVSTSPQIFGMTFPGPFTEPGNEASQKLAIAAEFKDLRSVPAMSGDGSVACSAYPAQRDSSDLLQVALQSTPGTPAWTAAVNTEEGYLWFTLRDSALLPSTILWIENCGRNGFPWNGRNCSIGIEDVCSYFDKGSDASCALNAFSRRGIKTAQSFSRFIPYYLPYIQGAIAVPAGFGRVQSVTCNENSISFFDSYGACVSTSLDTGFVLGKGKMFEQCITDFNKRRN